MDHTFSLNDTAKKTVPYSRLFPYFFCELLYALILYSSDWTFESNEKSLGPDEFDQGLRCWTINDHPRSPKSMALEFIVS